MITKQDYSETWSIAKWLAFVVALFFIGIVILQFVAKPFALVGQVTEPAKIINNYEWFHAAFQDYSSKVALIAAQKKELQSESDRKEKTFLRTELTGVQAMCRDLVSKYNARSESITIGIYKGTSLPQNLSMKECE